MFLRVDKLLIPLQKPKNPDPNGAAAVQELLGGKFGEMSTLNNYLHQSFGFREKKKLKPFYDLISSIATEEVGHVELVSTAINLMLEGETPDGETPERRWKQRRTTATRITLLWAAAAIR